MYNPAYYRQFRSRCLLVAVWLGAVILLTPAGAETERHRRQQADECIREALHYEIYAAMPERQRLLAQSLELAPDHPPARWQNGYVRYFNDWVQAAAVPQIGKLQNQLSLYERQRDRTPQHADGWLALANWCAKNGFPRQERAHLSQILQEFPDHPEVRRRLGFQRVGGRWIESETLWSGVQQSVADHANLREWAPRLETVAKKLRSRDEARRVEAEEELLSITDVAAVPALERLAGSSEQHARVAIRVLGNMSHYQASAALTRLGVFSPWPDARQQAALELAQHPNDNYIPALLAEMATPISSRIQSLQVNGRLLYRQTYVREVQDQTQTAVLDTLFQPEYVVLGDGDVADVDLEAGFADLMAQAFETAAGGEQRRLVQNQLIAVLNWRICQVLRFATGEQLGADPRAWWDWWDQVNQVKRFGDKLDNQEYRQQRRSYVVPVYTSQSSQDQPESQPTESQAPPPAQPFRAQPGVWYDHGAVGFVPLIGDCFVAGTPVWTARGRMNIELVVPGDLALSQDANTGELDYKPVLQVSRRPPEPLVKILTSCETLEASGGHALWVNGEAWVLVRQMKSGMVLHGANGSVHVRDVLPGSYETTYNLVVADFHTYFVGEGKVLSHDNTARRPTNAQVPGFASSPLR